MGSFDMNASFSKMPLLDKATLVICLKREIEGEVRYLPLTYPVVGHYYDYGELHNFEENEITKAICDFFDMNDLREVTEFIYDMSIRGDYQNCLNNIANGKTSCYQEKYDKYVKILDKLRKGSELKILTEDELKEKVEQRIKDSFSRNGKICNLSEKEVTYIKEIWLNQEIKLNEKRTRILNSYELSLFYENTPLFEALCGIPEVDTDTGIPELTYDLKESSDDVSVWGKYILDNANTFVITKDCNSQETIEIKKSLVRLYHNFKQESKTFIFEEPTILGQDSCPYMWYQYGKAAHKMWMNELNSYSKCKFD